MHNCTTQQQLTCTEQDHNTTRQRTTTHKQRAQSHHNVTKCERHATRRRTQHAEKRLRLRWSDACDTPNNATRRTAVAFAQLRPPPRGTPCFVPAGTGWHSRKDSVRVSTFGQNGRSTASRPWGAGRRPGCGDAPPPEMTPPLRGVSPERHKIKITSLQVRGCVVVFTLKNNDRMSVIKVPPHEISEKCNDSFSGASRSGPDV